MRNLWFTGGSYADKVEVKSLWFELISSGTSGVLTPPAGSSIVLDQWAAGVDALASQVDGGIPSYISPFAADGSVITATLNSAGEWTLSGTPSAYPVAIIYVYKVALAKFDSSKSIGGIEVINNVNVGEAIHASPAKTTPVDADTLPIIDSAVSNVLKKVTWANLKATLKTYNDTLYYRPGGTDVAITDGGTGASTAATAFTALKQSATTSATGVVELATRGEVLVGMDTTRAVVPVDLAAKVAIDVNPRALSQAVAMTAATSGSNGIQVAHSALYANTTNSFTTHLSRRLASWTTAAILKQKHNGTSGVIVAIVATTGVIRLTLNSTVYDSAVPGGGSASSLAAGTEYTITIVINVGATTTTVSFYIDGLLLNTTAAQANVDLTNTAILYSMGTSAVRTAGVDRQTVIFNRALTAAEVLALYRNGIAEGDKWGSQQSVSYNFESNTTEGWVPISSGRGNPTVNSTNPIAGTYDLKIPDTGAVDFWGAIVDTGIITTTSSFYRLKVKFRGTHNAAWRFAGVSSTAIAAIDRAFVYDINVTTDITTLDVIIPPTNNSFVSPFVSPYSLWLAVYSMDATVNDLFIDDLELIKLGATLALLPEGIQPAPGQWLDASTNKLHAMLPAEGSSLTRSKWDFEFRSTNVWAASAAAQYIGGVNQNCLTTKHFIEQIICRATVTTSIQNIDIGDGSDIDEYVAAATPAAAPALLTIISRIADGTNMKLVVTPAASATMTLEFIIRGRILE